MLPVTISKTGVGNSPVATPNTFVSPFNIGFGVVITGTVTYTVQHTFDGTNWFNHATVAAAVANADGNYAFPVKQIRVNVSAGTGSATLTMIQAGIA
jgi:hypothetical protein